MMKKLRILHTPVRFYPYIGGVENHVYYLAKQLSKDYDMTVICANDVPSKPKKIEGVKVKRLSYLFKVTNTNITLTLPFNLLRQDFDIVHTHMPTPWTCDWSILIAKLKGKKSVLTIHNDMQKGGLAARLLTDFYLNTMFRISLALVNQIIIVNPDWEKSFTYTKKLIQPHERKITIVPNGVDTELFRPGKKKEPKTLLFVSILDKHHIFKGFDYLLEAIPIIQKQIPDVKLYVIGEGSLKQVYTEKAKQMNINGIEFLGEKNQSELAQYFSQSTLFVLPSIHTEGFGIVLLESLACKTPVITTTIAGVATEIKESRCGVVVDPKNSQQLANAIIKILENKKEYESMSQRARALIEEKYSWKKVSQSISQLYKSL